MSYDFLAKKTAEFLTKVSKVKPQYRERIQTILKAVELEDFEISTVLLLDLLEDVRCDGDLPECLKRDAEELFLNLIPL